jgi:hypothetical protein
VGMTEFRHRGFGLGDLFRSRRQDNGPFPGNVAWTYLAAGPEDRSIARCGQVSTSPRRPLRG